MTMYRFDTTSIPPHPKPMPPEKCKYLEQGHCYWCCHICNIDDHTCGGCGTLLDHNGRELHLGQLIKHEGCTDAR